MKLLNESQTAELLQVTRSCLRRMRRERRGPAFVRVGKLIRYSESALEDFIKANTEAVILHKRGKLTSLCS